MLDISSTSTRAPSTGGRIVITSIQAPTASVVQMAEMASSFSSSLIVVGDKKTPECEWPDSVEFISLQAQQNSEFRLAARLPLNHYGRKNLGYLAAFKDNAGFIFDTDDDNAPMASWLPRQQSCVARRCAATGWINAYQPFSDEHIWPRGLPLTHAGATDRTLSLASPERVNAPVQQGLANGSPDVDAVWRLLLDKEVIFRAGESISLPRGAWCPFNSQSTWWFQQAYPLMYLPSFVSFRMTDIWRSFVAQRCLWELGLGVVFHGPEMFQDRNEHSLMRDFEQEIPGYLNNERIREKLEATALLSGEANIGGNLHRCYEALVDMGIVPAKEMPLVEAWLADVDAVRPVNRPSSE